jgi:hypothetical protein
MTGGVEVGKSKAHLIASTKPCYIKVGLAFGCFSHEIAARLHGCGEQNVSPYRIAVQGDAHRTALGGFNAIRRGWVTGRRCLFGHKAQGCRWR